jgi:hypothetical protein
MGYRFYSSEKAREFLQNPVTVLFEHVSLANYLTSVSLDFGAGHDIRVRFFACRLVRY